MKYPLIIVALRYLKQWQALRPNHLADLNSKKDDFEVLNQQCNSTGHHYKIRFLVHVVNCSTNSSSLSKDMQPFGTIRIALNESVYNTYFEITPFSIKILT